MGSALGKALSMSTSNTWATVVSKLTGVSNRGALNWSGSNTTYSVPAGYYSGGTLDSRPSYTNGYNAGHGAGYTSGHSAGYSAGVAAKTTSVSGQWSGGHQGGFSDDRNQTRVFTAPSAGGYIFFGAVTLPYNSSNGTLNIMTNGACTCNAVVNPHNDYVTWYFLYAAKLNAGQWIRMDVASEGAGQAHYYSILKSV